jgi:hypothetical protein
MMITMANKGNKEVTVGFSPEQLAALKIDLAATIGEAHAREIEALGRKLTEAIANGAAEMAKAVTGASDEIVEIGSRLGRMEAALAANVSAQERPLTIVQVEDALKAETRQVFCVLGAATIGSVKLLAGTKISNQGHNIIDLARAGVRLKLEV